MNPEDAWHSHQFTLSSGTIRQSPEIVKLVKVRVCQAQLYPMLESASLEMYLFMDGCNEQTKYVINLVQEYYC